MANVRFYQVDVKSKFDALLTKDPLALYWIQETKELYKGDVLFGTGAMASEQAAGLLSAADYAELRRLIAAGMNLVPIATAEIAGKVKASDEIAVADDGRMSLVAVPVGKVTGLEERLTNIEQASVGGVHYRGSVATFEDLPADAQQGDLYEVLADGTEWCFNGEKWFEYGGTKMSYNKNQFSVVDGTLNLVAVDAGIIDCGGKKLNKVLDAIPELYIARKYDISNTPVGALVDYRDHEIRIMCPADTEFTKQSVGAGGDSNTYYMTLKTYAPNDSVVGYIEHIGSQADAEVLTDLKVDAYGRKYQPTWLGLAKYDEATGTWTYYGKNSSIDKYIGWDYQIDWYNADGVMVSTDSVRINLSNEDCHNVNKPYFMAKYATVADVDAAMAWGEI